MPKRTMIIIGVVLLLLIGGGAAYFLTREDTADTNQTNKTTSESAKQESADGAAFAPLSTESEPFVATLTTEGAPEQSAKIEYDGKGVMRYTATTNGQQIEMIYTQDAYYTCMSSEQCFKYDLAQSGAGGVDTESFQYDKEEIAALSAGAVRVGTEKCPAGTCDVWTTKMADGAPSSKIYIDKKTKRISQVVTTINGQTSTMVYEFKPVTITVPANAQSLPTAN